MKFDSWSEVLQHCAEGLPVYYQAPLDLKPTKLRPRDVEVGPTPYTYEARPRTVRIWPPGSIGRGRRRTADPFSADAKHLSRFSHEPQDACIDGAYKALGGRPLSHGEGS